MKTATIKFSSFDKSFSTPNGTFYSHSIELSNGDKGQINTKDESPSWLRAGQELNYEITPNGKFPDKIKRVNLKFAGSNNALADRVVKLEEVVKQLVKHTKMAYIAPKEPVNANGNSTINPDDSDLPF